LRARIRRHAFRDRAELRRAAEKPLGRDGIEGRRRDRDHHAAAGRVMGMMITPHTPLSSPGLTGRPSTPRLLDSIAGFPAYWIPAFAGMTSGAGVTRGAGMTSSASGCG